MPEPQQHESADLRDYEVLDASDTLDGAPGIDPLDQGIVTPEHWSAGMRFGTTAAEQAAGESLDQLLAKEMPDVGADDGPGDGWDENAPEEDVAGLLEDQGPDPRTGRLVARDGAFTRDQPDYVANDVGIDGGGASAEEAAVHVVLDDND
jgi:hypothetical protein